MARHNNYGDLLRLAATKQFSKSVGTWGGGGGGGGGLDILLDILLNLIKEQDKQKEDVLTLGNALYKMFKTEGNKWILNTSPDYKITKFFTVYMDTVNHTEPTISATTKLASLYFFLSTCTVLIK